MAGVHDSKVVGPLPKDSKWPKVSTINGLYSTRSRYYFALGVSWLGSLLEAVGVVRISGFRV